MRNSMSAAEEDEGWDPSGSEEEVMMLSRSSKMMTEGEWSKASDM